VDLTDDDAEFERNVVGLIRAEPQPSPLVPPPTSVPPPSGEESDVGDSPEDPLPVAPPVVPPPGSSPPDSRPGTGPRDPRPRWLLPAVAAAAVVVLGVVGLLVAGGGGGGSDTPDAGATSVASKAPDGDRDGSTVVDAGEAHSISTTDGNAYIAVDSPLESETGGHQLVMTPGGRLELRTGDEVVWTPTYFEPPVPGAVAILQESDGNLVVYPVAEPTAEDRALWAIGEQPGAGVELRVFDDDGWGVVAVFRNGREIWRRGGAPAESHSGSTPVSEPVADTPVPTESTRTTDEPAPTTTEPPFATASDLDGRSFVASSVEGRTLVDGTDLTMSFDDDRLSYNGGCNTTELRYELDAGVLGLIGPFLTSLIACDVAVSEQDRWFSDLLGADPTLTIVGGALIVSDGDVTITFR
ncbi:MAG: META domain-containing protein, partial [Actinomycetota bacterium]